MNPTHEALEEARHEFERMTGDRLKRVQLLCELYVFKRQPMLVQRVVTEGRHVVTMVYRGRLR